MRGAKSWRIGDMPSVPVMTATGGNGEVPSSTVETGFWPARLKSGGTKVRAEVTLTLDVALEERTTSTGLGGAGAGGRMLRSERWNWGSCCVKSSGISSASPISNISPVREARTLQLLLVG